MPCPSPLPDAAWRRVFRRRVRAWYAKHARDLPWRRTGEPYAVWVSEIMLQQTQVATVVAYFNRFMRALPTVEALAAADESEVLRLWEGLGYYRRARQLHQAARLVVEQHNGRFPRDPVAARKLPGVGRYTAGAILSIAFDDKQPILEANTIRLFTRLLAYRDAVTSAEGQRLLWSMAQIVLPRRDVGRFNQGLMELGSEICLARAPRCDDCPTALLCRARASGLQTQIPVGRSKPALQSVREAAVVIRRRGRLLLRQCPEGGRWAGLWDFPRFAVDGRSKVERHREIVDGVLDLTGVTVKPGKRLTTIKHGVTRFRITLDCYEAQYLTAANSKAVATEMKWLRPDELDNYPLSTTGRILAKLVR